MRLFVAIETGPEVAHGVGRLLEELRARVRQAAPGAKVTWVAPERAHITVRFIGAADDARASAIRSALEPPLDVQPFHLEVAGIGMFPSHGRPRVIWAGVTDGRQPMVDVERQVSLRLDPILGPGEDRGYTPHLTLGRVRDAAGLTRRVCDRLEATVLGSATIDAVTLFESRMSPKGSTYIPLLRTPLRQAGP